MAFASRCRCRTTPSHTRISAVLGDIPDLALEFVYVNDGSLDHTESILRGLAEQDARIKFLSLSRNFGHQPAVSAGLAHADGDIVAVLDADLQGPDGLDLLQRIKQQNPKTEVVMVGRTAGDSTSVAAKSSAYDYLRKPFELTELAAAASMLLSAKRS